VTVTERSAVAGGVSASAPRQGVRAALFAQREITLVAMIGGCAVALALLRPEFLRASNLLSIATSVVYDLPLAAGMTLVLIVRGIDLSVGAVLALSGVVTTLALRDGWPLPVAIAAGFLLAVGIGALNGLLVARLRLAPFIVTLGTMSMARGTAVVLTSGYMISGLPPSYLAIGRSEWLGVALPVWLVVLFLVGFDRLIRRWQPLHDAFFAGGNHEAARLSGLPAVRLTAAAYVVSALCAALAALFVTSRLGMGYAKFGELAELRAIAAAVLGGATFSGGAGSVTGAALGVLLLAVVMNGFVLLNLSIYWQSVATGLIVVIAVGLDTARRRRRGDIA
jgi:ribose transport system permease protein